MTAVSNPKTSFTEGYGWCCFMHWSESGMHIYSWDDREPKFFSIDIYTCKLFDPWDVARYTEEFHGDNLIKLRDHKIAIKVDVERSEKYVLLGFEELILNNKIFLQIEIFDQHEKEMNEL